MKEVIDMAKSTTSISIDTDVKEKALPILNELGLDLSTTVGMLLRQVIRERRLPFDVALDVPNATTIAALKSAAAGEDIHGPFNTVAELMEALNA